MDGRSGYRCRLEGARLASGRSSWRITFKTLLDGKRQEDTNPVLERSQGTFFIWKQTQGWISWKGQLNPVLHAGKD